MKDTKKKDVMATERYVGKPKQTSKHKTAVAQLNKAVSKKTK